MRLRGAGGKPIDPRAFIQGPDAVQTQPRFPDWRALNAQALVTGGAEVQSLAQQGCQERFADYVGRAYEDSAYYFSAIAPTRKSWEDRGDRRVLCSIIASDGGRLEGSVAAGEANGDAGADG